MDHPGGVQGGVRVPLSTQMDKLRMYRDHLQPGAGVYRIIGKYGGDAMQTCVLAKRFCKTNSP